MLKHSNVAILSMACLLIGACASTPRTLKADAAPKRSLKAVEGVSILSVTDKRGKDAMLSDMRGNAMDGEDLMSWLTLGLAARGLPVSEKDGAIEGCRLNLELRKAEMGGLATSKTATVVLGARNPETGDYKILRGQDASINWIGGTGESNSALARALDEAVANISEAC